MSKSVIVYSSGHCPYCDRAKALLDHKGVAYDSIRVDQDPAQFDEMMKKSGGKRTVPQIFVGDHHVGGFDDLHALDQAGKLDPLLAD